MSEEMNLPGSLDRQEISPDKSDCCKQDETCSNQSQRHPINSDDEPERILEGLSIGPCTKGTYTLSVVTDSRKKGLKRLVNRRPILMKSKLSQAVLRAPALRLPGDLSFCSPPLATTPESFRPLTALLPGRSSGSQEEPTPPSSSPSDDNSMEDLASYFDIFVQIPKNMSEMAETMYS